MAATLVQPSSFLKLIGHELRWRLMEALVRSDRRVQELVALVGEPANLVSYHLRRLRDVAIVRERRSEADGRDIYYSLDLERLRGLYLAVGETLHPGLGTGPQTTAGTSRRRKRSVRVLFLCTHNSARSQMAEGILRHLGGGRVEVQSAGTVATRVHPLAVAIMAERRIDISQARSKHLEEFAGERFDYVVTVCDNAREACPVFHRAPELIHWSIADPSIATGSEEVRRRAFRAAADDLTTRIRYLLVIIERKGG